MTNTRRWLALLKDVPNFAEETELLELIRQDDGRGIVAWIQRVRDDVELAFRTYIEAHPSEEQLYRRIHRRNPGVDDEKQWDREFERRYELNEPDQAELDWYEDQLREWRAKLRFWRRLQEAAEDYAGIKSLQSRYDEDDETD